MTSSTRDTFPYKKNFLKYSPQEMFDSLISDPNIVKIVRDEKGFPIQIIRQQYLYEKINVLSDYYNEYARIRSRIHKRLSPYEFWQQNERKVRMNAQNKYQNQNMYSLRETLFEMCKEANTFSPILSKCIYDLFVPEEGGSVLDPCSGWGDRAIGALASSRVQKYQGVDPNMNLLQGYENLKKDLDVNNKLNFSMIPFEEFKTDEKYDVVFTSTPYFDYEIYTDSKKQSCANKDTYEQWFSEWMIPALDKMIFYLRQKGYLIIHVGQTFRTPTFDKDVQLYLQNRNDVTENPVIQCGIKTKNTFQVYQKNSKSGEK